MASHYSPDAPKSVAVLVRGPQVPFVCEVVNRHEEGMFPVLKAEMGALKYIKRTRSGST